MKILVITSNYPSKSYPNYGAFVYNLMQELGKQHDITIISPFKMHHQLKRKQQEYGKERCIVKRPVFLSVSNRKLFGVDFKRLSSYNFKRAVRKELLKLPEEPDLVYTHFLTNAIPVLDYVQEKNIPLVVASGESTYSFWDNLKKKHRDLLHKRVLHVISVSEENRQQLVELGFDENKISVIPNAVNYNIFKPLNRIKCRTDLNFPKKKFIVGFIGHFIHRKGPNRIIEAIKDLNDEEIHLICVGGRGELIANRFTTKLPPVPNSELPKIYNSFDVFVLPTLHEGHCNVIEEAKACAIPIISSLGTSVEEQIDKETGILVDPLNITEIGESIALLKMDGDLRVRFSNNLLKRRGENSLQARARKIGKILAELTE